MNYIEDSPHFVMTNLVRFLINVTCKIGGILNKWHLLQFVDMWPVRHWPFELFAYKWHSYIFKHFIVFLSLGDTKLSLYALVILLFLLLKFRQIPSNICYHVFFCDMTMTVWGVRFIKLFPLVKDCGEVVWGFDIPF